MTHLIKSRYRIMGYLGIINNRMHGGVLYIYGIKGLACIWVMLGHVLSELHPLYDEATFQVADLVCDYLYIFGNNVAMFSLISGFLAAKSGNKVESFKDYIRYIIRRYFRFSIPCFFAVVFAYCILMTIGFRARYGSFGLLDILKYSAVGMFCGDNSLNPPFWMMGDIFWGSVVCITVCFLVNISHLWGRKKKIFFMTIITAIAAMIVFFLNKRGAVFYYVLNKWVIWDVVAGMILYKVANSSKKIDEECKDIQGIMVNNRFILILFLVVHLIGIVLRNNYSVFYARHTFFSEFWLQISVFECIAVFLCIYMSGALQNFFSNSFLVWFGRRSFWIFALHYPVICSVTYRVAQFLLEKDVNHFLIIIITIIVTTTITGLFAELFYIGEIGLISMMKKVRTRNI